MSDLYCVLAEHGLGVNNQGHLAPCCQWQAHQLEGAVVKWYDSQRFDDVVRPRIVSDLRAGIKHAGCSHCWQEEALNHKSMRLIWNSRIPSQAVAQAQQHNDVLDIELSLGNKCNLRCIMCGPYASSQWETALQKNPRKLARWQITNKDREEWWEQPGFVEWLRPMLATALRIDITGGEPLILPQTLDILQHIIDLDRGDSIHVQFNTNLTRVNDSVMCLLSKLKRVSLIISLEGIGEKNNYLRYPAKWSDIEDNLVKIRKNLPRCYLGVNHTLQHTSVYSLPDLAYWCYDNDLMLHLTTVQGMRPLSIKGTPPQDLERFLKWTQEFCWPGHRSNLYADLVKDYVQSLGAVTFDIEEYRNFRDYIAVIDEINDMAYDEIFCPSTP